MYMENTSENFEGNPLNFRTLALSFVIFDTFCGHIQKWYYSKTLDRQSIFKATFSIVLFLEKARLKYKTFWRF